MILLYHNVVPDNASTGHFYTRLTLRQSNFRRHIEWLTSHFDIVSLSEYLNRLQWSKKSSKNVVAITFDDGTFNTFQCAFPILEERKAPATFFVTTCHLNKGRLLWGSYINALCYEGIYGSIAANGQVLSLDTWGRRIQSQKELVRIAISSGDPVCYMLNLSKQYPLPESVIASYRGMTSEQLHKATNSELIEIGSHSTNHPFLDHLSKKHQKREIFESKQVLADITGKNIRYFAYPSGVYNKDTLEFVKLGGYEAAFAVKSKLIGDNTMFEIERIGIYSPSILKLHIKALGLVGLIS